jgi:O-acetyl-ADP-ribose deacetylase (regulator of RNase III)
LITYLKGDATEPVYQAGSNAIIAHICNDVGAWGAGFVLALSSKWHRPETWYRVHSDNLELGRIQLVPVGIGLYVCNMIAQESVGFIDGREPIRYDALIMCLRKLNRWIKDKAARENPPVASRNDYLIFGQPFSVHMPKIGTGLGGGRWEIIEPIINIELASLPVTVYDFEPK